MSNLGALAAPKVYATHTEFQRQKPKIGTRQLDGILGSVLFVWDVSIIFHVLGVFSEPFLRRSLFNFMPCGLW